MLTLSLTYQQIYRASKYWKQEMDLDLYSFHLNPGLSGIGPEIHKLLFDK